MSNRKKSNCVALFSYWPVFCCRVFWLPIFPVAIFSVAVISDINFLLPFFLPCYFSLPNFTVAQFSGSPIFCCPFYRCFLPCVCVHLPHYLLMWLKRVQGVNEPNWINMLTVPPYLVSSPVAPFIVNYRPDTVGLSASLHSWPGRKNHAAKRQKKTS